MASHSTGEQFGFLTGRWVSVNDAMRIAGVSRRTIYNWLKANSLRTVRTAGGVLRIDPGSLFRRS